jgi:glutathione S-transferase
VLWLIEELQIPYNLINHKRVNGRAGPELKEIHPLGKAPILVTTEGRVIAESSAIAKYLIDTYDTDNKFKGDEKNDALRDEQLTSFSATNLNAFVIVSTLFNAMSSRSPFFVRPLMNGIHSMLKKGFLDTEFKAQFKYLDDQLEGQDYFMGKSPGRADFMMSWPIDMAAAQDIVKFSEFPRLKAWHERCKARDGWKRGIEKGNGYDLRTT